MEFSREGTLEKFILRIIKEKPKTSFNTRTATQRGRYRSISDIAKLCKKYKNANIKQVIKTIKTLIDNEEIDAWKCGDINKLVFEKKYPYTLSFLYHKTEFGYSLKELYEEI